MSSGKEHPIYKWIGIPFILFMIGFMIFNQWTKTLPQRYTICVITKVTYKSARKGGSVYYEYQYKNQKYKWSTLRSGRDYLKVGKRFYLTLPIDYPSFGGILPECPVPSHIKKAPSNGWSLEELKKLDKHFKADCYQVSG